MGVSMIYGGYSISPVPLISIGKTYQKTAAGIAVGTVFDLTINGNIAEITGAGSLGIIFGKQRELRSAFDRDGKLFQITDCTGGVIWECYPRIINEIRFNESPDNWVFTCPYSLTIECDHEPVNQSILSSGENIPGLMPPYISNYNDSWSFEFDDAASKYSLSTTAGTDSNNIILRATHEVGAVGKSHWKGPGLTGTLEKPAWQWAEDVVLSKLNASPINPLISGVFNVSHTGLNTYNHFRVQRMSESDGSFTVTETFILGNSNGVIEDFNVEIRSSNTDPFVQIGINGNIQGLETRTYGTTSGTFNISRTKYESASAFYDTIKDGSMIYPRAQALVASDGTLNVEPLTKTVGRSPTKGTVTYSYEYNTRPSNCITGAKTENIQVQDENPNDVFARISILGRRQGPILQSFNTITEFKRSVTIDVVMTPATGCSISTLVSGNSPKTQVANILCGFENDLKGRYDKVYKDRDSVSWEPKYGRYNRTVSWSAVPCTDNPAISPCSGA